MKLSYEWLKSFLPGLTQTPEQVAELLTMYSYETVVAGRRMIDPHVTIVKITKLAPHPNADRLRLATVTDGTMNATVVCGAPNIQEGDVVPFSPPGAQLHDEAGQIFTLKQAKIRGVESPGMLNSLRELGLGTSHAGIFIIPTATPLGSKLKEHIPDDVILEADITRNRASDSLSHRGVARELGVILGLPVVEPTQTLPAAPILADWNIVISEPAAAPRYLGAVLDGITVGLSPLWLQARLLAVEARPINNIVDITNYVMFELGNPTHAFDVAKLSGKTMGVRFATKGETLTLLDGTTQYLFERMLVITNDDRPVALAGIMGGQNGEVSESTTTLFLEAATFDSYTIQTTSTKLGLRSEAATRFIKGIDASLAEQAQARVIGLLQEIAGGNLRGIIDEYPQPRVAPVISFSPRRVERVSGIAIDEQTIERTLMALGMTIEKGKESWLVTPPAIRLDVTGEHDLVEEVIRLYGLDKIASQPPQLLAEPLPLPANIAWREAIRDLLVRAGMTETYNYSFAPGVLALQLGEDESQAIEINNPVAPEARLLRQSLVPGLSQNLQKNKGEWRTQQLFEVGAVFARGSGGAVAGVRERTLLGGVVTGEDNGAMKVEMIVDRILAELDVTDVLKKAENKALGALTQLVHQDKPVGRYGEFSAKVRQTLKLTGDVAFFELDLSMLIPLATTAPPPMAPPATVLQEYRPISKYPPVWRDISLLVSPDVGIEHLQQIIEEAGGTLVTDVDLFDVYDAADIEHDADLSKSVAFHIKYQSSEKTLTDDEVASRHNEIVAALKRELGAQIRE